MTDRELLEAAARACGYQHKWNLDGLLIDATCGRWNPLTDDGDALRLAVKLRLEIRPDTSGQEGVITVAGDGVWEEVDASNCTREKATRRAIVRAAAGITRSI